MTQTMYAYMNKIKIKKNFLLVLWQRIVRPGWD
jgi:hypothetical protein